ncbi:psbP domain-containing protein 2, chloroplastic [Euphorbia lathyris]|uniref:psbP domain-containing protein 2, chloroplastic n=1 Tax=Euphorbia lathyris TaxID=212925 RepID=UPI003314334B
MRIGSAREGQKKLVSHKFIYPMALRTFFCISTQLPYLQINTPKNSLSLPFSKSSFLNTNTSKPFSSTKRTLNLAILSLIISGSLPNFQNSILAIELDQFQRYTDSKEAFTLLRPSSYVMVDKAGATVFFADVNKETNNIGVVVNPVRLTSLAEFGTPQFVADKLIQAEKRKESTKDAEVIGVGERSGHGGLQIYEFEYKVDSTRGGIKRIFSAAFVASNKLYLLNISHSDTPLDTPTRTMLQNVLHSFDIYTPHPIP